MLSTVGCVEDEERKRFDPSGPQLVYIQIADDIAAKINSGELAPDARLPSELDMAADYGAARLTVRRAIRELRERGLVHTVIGKGTFVTRRDNG